MGITCYSLTQTAGAVVISRVDPSLTGGVVVFLASSGVKTRVLAVNDDTTGSNASA